MFVLVQFVHWEACDHVQCAELDPQECNYLRGSRCLMVSDGDPKFMTHVYEAI